MGRNATRAQQAKARVREARLVLMSERQAQDERMEEATVRTVLAWEDVVTAQARLDAAERQVGDALAALGKEKVPVAQMVTLTGIGRPQCARLLRLAVTQPNAAESDCEPGVIQANAAPPGTEPAVTGDVGGTERG